MKIHFFTIAYEAMPWITMHYPTLRQLDVEWEWHISEGPASPVNDTSWCKSLPYGPSKDGTVEYLRHIASIDPRVHVYQHPLWEGKAPMCNVSLDRIKEPTIVWEIDADEIWTVRQIQTLHRMFECEQVKKLAGLPHKNAAQFLCRCWMGPRVLITSINTYGNNTGYEWRRAWVAEPGFKFIAHEPPSPNQNFDYFSHADTESMGLVFDHYSYATAKQVAFKEHYYGYTGALRHWEALQLNTVWPVKLREWLPWIHDEAVATKV